MSVMILYNLFPLMAGRFPNWGEHLSRAAALGFDWVFINPIQQLGASRSLYSIADYFQVNPAFVDPHSTASPEDQVRQVTAQARQTGLKVMIDLVINHCAIDSALTRQHPDWFLRDSGGKIANSSCHNNGVAEHLLGLGFEGFRCDAAYQVPPELWRRLIRDVKTSHPHTVFIAETLGCSADETKETARAGFDFVFNSSKWWNLHDWWLIEQYDLVRETTRSISFPESHDTPRLCEELNGNVDGLKQRYLFSALFSAGVMMPIGFEYGLRKPLDVIQTSPADWQKNRMDISPFITKVNAIKNAHAVFREESPTSILPCQNPNVLLMWKASAKHKDEALLILNKDLGQHQEFYTDHFRHFVQSRAPLRDVSPEYPLEYIHEPFHYALRPGQGIVLVTSRT